MDADLIGALLETSSNLLLITLLVLDKLSIIKRLRDVQDAYIQHLQADIEHVRDKDERP